MPYKTSRRVSFRWDIHDKSTIVGGQRAAAETTTRVAGMFGSELGKSSDFRPANLISNLGTKVSRVLCFITMRRKSSSKVSSASLTRSRSLADAQRAQAIEDCIKFLNSSSSFHRSTSVSSS